MKTFKTVLFLAAILFIGMITSCESNDDENPSLPEETILDQRDAFWANWKKKCFPNEDWNLSTFTTFGKNYTTFKTDEPITWQEMQDLYADTSSANKYLPGVIESGSTFPVSQYLNAGDKLYKFVPSGKDIQTPSPYYVTESQLKTLQEYPSAIEQSLGLPLSSVAGEYWIYTITSTQDSNLVFSSTIAPTTQYANATPRVSYNAPGGATQTLVINNGDVLSWKKGTTPAQKYIPGALPKVEK